MTSTDGPGLLTADRRMTIRRLPFIEGLRGIAALVVFLGHTVRVDNAMFLEGDFLEATWRERLAWLVWPGAEMVLLFLMVSAFSLSYSETVRRSRGFAGSSYRQFFLRRAWRVAPPYYAALLVGAVAVVLTPSSFTDDYIVFAPTDHVTTSGVLSHLLFVHNASPDWRFQINGPLWTMAWEVQLYAVFPLLYWAARRWNPWLVCLPAFVGAEAVSIATDIGQITLAGFFALGLLAAEVYPRITPRMTPWLLGVGLAALLVALAHVFPGQLAHDLLWAVAFFALLLVMTRRPESRANPANARWARWVGLRSYSLYAMHLPIVQLVAYATRDLPGQPWVTTLVSVPIVALVVEVAYRLIEQPAMRKASQVGR